MTGTNVLNQSRIRKGSGNNSRGSASKLHESRFMSRMKGSMIGGKYKSTLRKKGSTKYSTVRETGDPVIYRDGHDVTPLPIQIDESQIVQPLHHKDMSIDSDTADNDDYVMSSKSSSATSNCFVPLIEPIYHPMSMSQHDDKKETEKENNNAFSINLNQFHLNVKNANRHNKNIGASGPSSARSSIAGNKLIICKAGDNEFDVEPNTSKFQQHIASHPHVLDENIYIDLSETETKILFEMPSLAVSNRESSKQERENVMKANQDYQECLLKHSDKDLFTTSWTQTYTAPMKEQAIHAEPPKTRVQATQSSIYDIHDAFQEDEPQKIAKQNKQRRALNDSKMWVDLNECILKQMQNSQTFQKNLMIMERAVVQNMMAEKQMLYRIHASTEKNEPAEFDFEDEEDDVEDNQEDENKQGEHDEKEEKPNGAGPKKSGLTVEIDLTPIDPTKPKETTEEKQEETAVPSKPALLHQTTLATEYAAAANLPHLQLLWNYHCTESENLECTAMDFNPLNTDLIVSGYGSWQFANKQHGKIMFWTLKNPTSPSRIYQIENTCVVSLNFSRSHPYLLSAGLFDGNVAVYDIRIESNDPILKSELNSAISDSKKQNQSSSSKHTTAVWNVLWEKPSRSSSSSNYMLTENKEENGNENAMNNSSNNEGDLHQRQKLFSIASDGIIKQWSMKKGFSSTNIMSLKRVPNLAAKRGSVIDNTIRSRQASGLCFDFPSNTNNTQYYVGTEDGIVHKCSVSYNEQVLRTYYGHTGPVYRLQCSPFDANKFITCSADWSINIWSQNKSSPMLSLQSSSNETVVDCCWSPFNSCLFASASESGILSIWNLEKNKKDPIISKDTKMAIKEIMFAPNAPAILCGQSDGNIQVYRLNCMNTSLQANGNEQQQIYRLTKALESDN